MNQKLIDQILKFQESEITEYHVYNRLAQMRSCKNFHNKETLRKIAKQENGHYEFLKTFSKQDVKPNKLKIWWYTLISKYLGLTFGLRLMESGEGNAQANYMNFEKVIPGLDKVIKDEEEHENELIGILDERKLQYVGSIVLGLNDALVELTGALAGLSFAFRDTNLVGIAGLITGIAASFSMGGSEYLSHRADKSDTPFTAALYTWIAYFFTVVILIIPYFIFETYYVALIFTLLFAVLIVAVFNFYIAVAQNEKFWHRFGEMVGLSFGIAFLSFLIGLVVRYYFGIDV